MKAHLLYGCLIDAAFSLAKNHEPAVYQELMYGTGGGRLRSWFPYDYGYLSLHREKLSEEQIREEHRRQEENVKILLSKRDRMVDAPAFPEADKIINRLQEILFLAYERHEITISVDDGNGVERLSPLLHTKTISWCEVAFPFDLAEDTVESHGQAYKVTKVQAYKVTKVEIKDDAAAVVGKPLATEISLPDNQPSLKAPVKDLKSIFQRYLAERAEQGNGGFGMQDDFVRFARKAGSKVDRDGPDGLRAFFKKETGRGRGRPPTTG